MTEILMRSDFALKVSFIDIFGRDVTLKKFNLSYSTQLSSPVVATFDGQNYSKNCIPQSDGVLILFDNPQLNVGQLKAHRQYTIGSSTFPDGERNINQIEMLPIEIVYKYSGRKQEPNPIDITPKPYEIIMFEQVVAEAIQGRTGENGTDGIVPKPPDYTSLREQILEGQYWFNNGGEKKQLYSKTIIGTFPSVLNGAIGIFGYIKSIEGIIDCYSEKYKEALYVNNSPAKFRDAGSFGIYFDIPSTLFGKSYKCELTVESIFFHHN